MDADVARIVGERLRELRIASGVSLRQFAADNGFNPNVISRIERGDHNVTLDTLFRVCRGLGVAPEKVLEGLR